MKGIRKWTFLASCFTIGWLSVLAQSSDQALGVPPLRLSEYRLEASTDQLTFVAGDSEGIATLSINGIDTSLRFSAGRAEFQRSLSRSGELLLIEAEGNYRLFHLSQNRDGSARLRSIPLWLSVLPPLVAIGLALLFKEVLVSLFIGIWMGSFIAGGLRIESFYYSLKSLLDVMAYYVLNALNDSGHLSVIIFSLLIGGMVAIISRNGGMAGVVQRLSKYAKDARSAQVITWVLGVAIFFDDYANTLIVGNTMRPVTDRFRVSREKLAYIVDSTAAPVAAVAFVTTWIGAELGYIDDGISQLPNWESSLTPYAIFLESLKYSFYPILTLLFILFLIRSRRDFGPMYAAEQRARRTGALTNPNSEDIEGESGETSEFEPAPGAPLRAYNAVLPVVVVILVTIYGLLDTGFSSLYGELVEAGVAVSPAWGNCWANMSALWPEGAAPSGLMKVGRIIGAADSYVALLWASLLGVLTALLLTVGGRILSLERTVGSLANGFKAMLPAVLILTLAWSLASTTEQLHTATFLTTALQGNLSPFFLPPIVFVLAAFISFSTGSSWSTMAILYPIAIPLTWTLCQGAAVPADQSLELLFNIISIVLAASVLGDHCSPISDTTILSSLASNCNHIDHVRTQLPYALTVGTVAIVLGTLSTALGGGWLLSLLLLAIGIAALYFLVRLVGKPVEEAA